MLDPPGPPRAQVLKKQREVIASTVNTKSSDRGSMTITDRGSMAIVTNREEPEPHSTTDNNHPGLKRNSSLIKNNYLFTDGYFYVIFHRLVNHFSIS